MNIHGIGLIYTVGDTITGLSGSAQSRDFGRKATTEKYLDGSGSFSATATFGDFDEISHVSYPKNGTTPPTNGTMVTVTDPTGQYGFITGSNWIVEETNFKSTNKGPAEQTVKLWRAPNITT
jgi:hypothetical protein